jgi:chromosomal replication initiator protein
MHQLPTATAAALPPSIWQACIQRLATRVSTQSYQMWLAPLRVVAESVDDAGPRGALLPLRVEVSAPNSYVEQWFELHFLAAVCAEARCDGYELLVTFAPVGLGAEPAATETDAETETETDAETETETETVAETVAETEAVPRNTFETFVVGSNNQMAHAAATRSPRYPPPTTRSSSTAAWASARPT